MEPFNQFLEEIFSKKNSFKETSGKISSLDLAKKLDETFCSLSKKLKFIHVTGTNGKGSVCFQIASSLAASGLNVGLFTSPHLLCPTERIAFFPRWSKQPTFISKEEFLNLGQIVLKACSDRDIPIVFFNLLFQMALCFFFNQKVDLAVIEVGIGGRFDTTNIITPILSVITSIDYDHKELLGSTLEEIGWQKAGIIKEGIDVVLGPTVIQNSVFNEIKNKKATFHAIKKEFPDYVSENHQIALTSLAVLSKKLSINSPSFSAHFTDKPPCRFEVISESKWLDNTSFSAIVLDVAHNPHGFNALIKKLQKELSELSFVFLVALSARKESKEILKALSECSDTFFFPDMEDEQFYKPSHLENQLKAYTNSSALSGGTVKSLFLKALSEKRERRSALICCGSFYLMKPILEILK